MSVEQNTTEACSICFETLPHDPCKVDCGGNHEFCFDCICGWLELGCTCPLCRGKISLLTWGADVIPVGGTRSFSPAGQADSEEENFVFDGEENYQPVDYTGQLSCGRCKKPHGDQGHWRVCFGCMKEFCFDCFGPFDECIECTLGEVGGMDEGEIENKADYARRQREEIDRELDRESAIKKELLESEFLFAMERLIYSMSDGDVRVFDEDVCQLVREDLFGPLRCLFSLTAESNDTARPSSLIRSSATIRTLLYMSPDADESFGDYYNVVVSDLEGKICRYFEEKHIEINTAQTRAICDVVAETVARVLPPAE